MKTAVVVCLLVAAVHVVNAQIPQTPVDPGAACEPTVQQQEGQNLTGVTHRWTRSIQSNDFEDYSQYDVARTVNQAGFSHLWPEKNFDDSEWRRGTMPFFQNVYCTTMWDLGFNPNVPDSKLVGGTDWLRGTDLYVRTHFLVNDVSGYAARYKLKIIKDNDIVVLKLNGVNLLNETQTAYRSDKCGDVVNCETDGSGCEFIPNTGVAKEFVFDFPPEHLVQGENVLAVQIRDRNLDNGDANQAFLYYNIVSEFFYQDGQETVINTPDDCLCVKTNPDIEPPHVGTNPDDVTYKCPDGNPPVDSKCAIENPF